MRSQNKRMIVGTVVLILLILAIVVLFPAKTLVTCIAAEHVNQTPYADRYELLQSQKTVKDAVIFGDLWVIESTSIFGGKQETLLMPCVSFVPSDVGTAGTTHWISQFEVLSNEDMKAHNVKARITADPNTGLSFRGFSDGYANDIYPEVEQKDHLYSATVSAATVDSSIEPNQECDAQAFWSADVSVRGTRTSCHVTIRYDAGYGNNVK